ncbi:MAG: glutamate--cysteine ligase [Gammaproteobacteria bacterium]|nr:glutamate--cysteine ligase [Gammaproteobacteria bacterium]
MGQEITNSHFHKRDYHLFQHSLDHEMEILRHWFEDETFCNTEPMVGLELEGWLIDSDLHPAAANHLLSQRLNTSLVVPELARFNIEINSTPQPLHTTPFSALSAELLSTWQQTADTCHAMNLDLVMTGILPTIQQKDFCLSNMSDLQRYRALNEQVMRMRQGTPLEFEIEGNESLHFCHHDVMMEAAGTSLQIHLQVPYRHITAAFNHAIRISAPMVALCANAPYLFGKDLWAESRIPLFEQAINVNQLSHRLGEGRVSFGTGYTRENLLDLFQENRDHYPIMLPICQPGDPQQLTNLMLHNGTIWRWNRPLVSLDTSGKPQLRIEHRVASAGPTLEDIIANTVFFSGVIMGMLTQPDEKYLHHPFATARNNFYHAARWGLESEVQWGRQRGTLRNLLTKVLIPLAETGLQQLELPPSEWRPWLEIIAARVATGQNGSEWQRRWVARHGRDPASLLGAYLEKQNSGNPVHQWNFS